MVADALPVLYIIAAAAQNRIGLFPQLLGDNSGHDLTRLVFEHHPFLRWEEFLLFGEHIHHLDLVSYIVALVFWIGDHIGHGGVGNFLAVEVAVALLPKDGFDLLHAVLICGVQLEQLLHHRCLFLVNDQPAVFLAIAENAAVSQHHVILDGLLMAKFYAATKLAQLVLGNGRHDGQPQFGVLIEGVDIVVLEEHAHAVAKELPRELDRVQRVTGKTGDLLGDDQIKFILCCILDHAVEVFTVLGRDAGQALVNVTGDERPCGVPADEVLIVLDLVAQRVQLFVRLGGHTGVVRHPQGNVIYALCPQLLADIVNVHGMPPNKFVVSCSLL